MLADPTCKVAFLLTGSLAASACAQTLNQLVEVEYDRLMRRTKERPLVTGAVSRHQAQAFAACTGLTGIGTLALFDPLTAFIGASTIGLYAGVYTPMKRMTPYNTHVGAVAGALPVLMGYTAAGASLLTPHPWALFALQAVWQFPHFYALAWIHREDYSRGGFKMFPLTMSGSETAALIKPYFAALAALPCATCAAGATSSMFLVEASLLTALWFRSFRRFEAKPTNATARSFFIWGLWYLLAMFASITLHSTLATDWRDRTRAKFRQWCLHVLASDADLLVKDRCPFEQLERFRERD